MEERKYEGEKMKGNKGREARLRVVIIYHLKLSVLRACAMI